VVGGRVTAGWAVPTFAARTEGGKTSAPVLAGRVAYIGAVAGGASPPLVTRAFIGCCADPVVGVTSVASPIGTGVAKVPVIAQTLIPANAFPMLARRLAEIRYKARKHKQKQMGTTTTKIGILLKKMERKGVSVPLWIVRRLRDSPSFV
jgi:hypothetical protein